MSSIWKKEISLRKKAAPGQEPSVEQGEPEATAEEAAAARTAPPLPGGDYGWLTADFDPTQVPEDMPAVPAPAVAAPPVSAPEPPAPPALPAVSTTAVASTHTPEPESEAPASRPAEPKVPFWKKELSLSRGAKEPKQAKAPKAKKARKAKKPTKAEAPKAASTPFWKKELGRRKKEPRKQKVANAPAPVKGGIVGLKIGASQVAAARVTNTSEGPQLVQVARIDLPEGMVVGGELRDVEGLTEALKELFAKNKLPKKGVRLGLANNRIGVRTFEIGGIDDPKQLANAIRFRAQETLPIPLEEAALDWRVLSERVDEESGQLLRRVLLVVAYRELVDRYVLACQKAGLKLSGIDLEAFAMLRALSTPLPAGAPERNGAQVVVNVGHDRSTFAVSDGRVCEFTRVLSWGGHNLSVAIARALDMTPSEAQPIKHALSLVATYAPPEGVPVESMNLARDVVARELQTFARELVSSLRFYQNQPGSLGIGELVLTGGTAHLPGLADELHRLIGVPVRVGDPLNRVALPKKFREPDGYAVGSLTVAIGLGIED